MASNEVVDSDFEQEHVVYKLRDFNSQMIKAWEEAFEKYIPDRIQVNFMIINRDGWALDDVEYFMCNRCLLLMKQNVKNRGESN